MSSSAPDLGILFFLPTWLSFGRKEFGAILADYRAKFHLLDEKRRTRLELFERLDARVGNAGGWMAAAVHAWENTGEVKRVESVSRQIISALNGIDEADGAAYHAEEMLFELKEAINEMIAKVPATQKATEVLKKTVLVMSQYYIVVMRIFEYAKDQQAQLRGGD